MLNFLRPTAKLFDFEFVLKHDTVNTAKKPTHDKLHNKLKYMHETETCNPSITVN